MIKTSQISNCPVATYDGNEIIWALDVGSTFVWKTKNRIDECVVVGIENIDGIRVPTAIRAYPHNRFARVHEIRNVD